MQNPDEDTEWNDVLRAKGILPPKPKELEIDESSVVDIVESVVKNYEEGANSKAIEDMTLEELEEMEDDADERVLLEYRQKRLAEMVQMKQKAKFGSVIEISAVDYINEVNKAGNNVWVVLHLYKTGIPLCALINQYLVQLAGKYPATKFIKSISTTCIPNYPDKNLPTIFVYHEGDLKGQIVGPFEFGGLNLKYEEFEWKISELGAIETTLEDNPFKSREIRDVLSVAVRDTYRDTYDSDDDSD